MLLRFSRRLLARPLCTGGASAGPGGAGVPGAGCDINFLDHRPVQRAKTKSELLRSLAVLRVCSVDLFVTHALLWMRLGRRLLGRRAFDALMRVSFFGQFVGGETEAELRRTAEGHRRRGLHPMIAVPMEEPVGRLDEDQLTRLYDENTDKQVRAVELSAELNDRQPKMQLKLTSLMPTALLRALADGCCRTASPETMTKTSASALAELLAGPAGRCPTADNRCQLLSEVDDKFSGQLTLGIDRVRRVFDVANRLQVQILIDAEYSHINAGISLFYLALALQHNAGANCLVFNTYQCYLRGAMSAYIGQTDFLLAGRVRAGAKLVRGAYLDWENGPGAALNSGRSQVWSSHSETNDSYNSVVVAALERVAAESRTDGRHEIILATHNTSSINLCLEKMRSLGLPNASQLVTFGQLYGMADYISCPLSELGCRVYKSIPYGSVEETLPYLVRRANENKLIFGGVREERNVLLAALRATNKLN